ncbi:chromate transporter [Tumebacillus sp. BK434]|uniref:chromate transporter n=1 Tax=Tumebacillus sp. BK434 TaxID=2512169 RepID=UPI00105268D2|nr:chromate transporter [Tumebacillus sp. BK434]TCP57886.1 chromate transporter [Tumebacillus sp. BK434]
MFRNLLEILLVSTKLGLTSFGGPVAHLGYFHNEYIKRRRWMDERSYVDLVALCQFLPGPASSQVGIGIGLMRAGLLGGLVAWIGFTLPSVLMLILFALLLQGNPVADSGWLHGLKIVAVAIVAQAIWGMGRSLAPDRSRATIAILATVVSLAWPSVLTQVVIIAVAGVLGWFLFRQNMNIDIPQINVPVSRGVAVTALLLFFTLLVSLPMISSLTDSQTVSMFDNFYRSGSLVFGGGHVVLPLLEREVVLTGWVSHEDFLAGYGATQAVPGPLFTFAAYLGAMINGWSGALLATVAIFLPAFLLVVGVLPFWDALRRKSQVQGALLAINASVVGILIAAFYTPIWTSSILAPLDFALAAVLFGMLVHWKLPPWVIVLAGALSGFLIG